MNAVADNSFTRSLSDLGKDLTPPKAILVISAHWQTDGVQILKADPPKTIYDFYGFPEELYRVRYDAPGAPEVSERLGRLLKSATLTSEWGLDHGAWSVLLHMYPQARVPVLQLSLNRGFNLQEHLDLAAELRPLREDGVMIVGSGNITHNLRALNPDPDGPKMDWAAEFDEMIKSALEKRDLSVLTARDPSKHPLWKQNHPSLEHFLPLLYAVGASLESESPAFPFSGFQHGSLSMRSVRYGA